MESPLAVLRTLTSREPSGDDGAALWTALVALARDGLPLDADDLAALRAHAARLVWPLATVTDPATLAPFEPLGAIPLIDLELVGKLRDRPEGIDALRGPGLGVVSRLSLSSNKLGPEAVELVAARPWWPTLRSLELDSNWLGVAGGEALADAPPAALRNLGLDDNELGDDGVAVLSSAPVLRTLVTLDLNLDAVTDAGVAALCDGERLPHLLALDLGGNEVTAAGAEALARCARWPALESLALGENPLGDDGAAALARGFAGGALRELWLDGCQIGDRGALALAEAPWLPALERLVLSWNPLTPRGVAALRAAPLAPGVLVVGD